MLDASEDDLPLFGEIKFIVAAEVTQYYLITDILNTVSFVPHYHAYEVEHNNSPTYHVIQPSNLIDHHPLVSTHATVHSQHFISLKYRVVST